MTPRLGKALLATSLAAFLLAGPAGADVLYDNSNITTGIGNGNSGANTSAIATNSTTFGFTSNGATLTYQLGEDFTLAASSLITGVTFDAYSTSTYPFPPTSPFTGATVSIWNAQPGTAGAAVLFSSSTLAVTAWTGVYRVQTTTLTNAQRPVFSLTVSFSNVPLIAGNYWIIYSITGVTSPGSSASIFTPPLMNTDGSMSAGNAIQSSDGGTTWAPTVDATTAATNRIPLTILGTAVPEPSSFALFTLSGLATLVTFLRRRSSAR